LKADALTSWLRAQVEKYVAPGMAIDDEHGPQDKYDGEAYLKTHLVAFFAFNIAK
jgi:hypothetical protein